MGYLKTFAKRLVPKSLHPMIAPIYHKLRSLQSVFYLGHEVACPCCGGHFRRFLPSGRLRRPNARCPRCGSLERHRLLWLYLKNRTNLFSDNLRVLHFAPQYTLQRHLSSMPNLDYISADLSSPVARVKMDITNILYEDSSFDVVLCNHVLEHVTDDRKAMQELFRVLRPGGWAILQSPIDTGCSETIEDLGIVSPEDRARIFGHPDHLRLYGRDYKTRLEESGFTVEVDGYVRELRADVIEKLVLNEHEDIYLCTKPEPG